VLSAGTCVAAARVADACLVGAVLVVLAALAVLASPIALAVVSLLASSSPAFGVGAGAVVLMAL
jgi:hypothetical protein